MPVEVKELVHCLARRNKADWGLVFADHENEPIGENDNADYGTNGNPTPEDNVFDLDNYVPNNFPAELNDGYNTYKNVY